MTPELRAEAEAARLKEDRDKWGPLFMRDLCRALLLPEDASTEAVIERVEALSLLAASYAAGVCAKAMTERLRRDSE